MEMKPIISLTYEFVFQIINTVICFLILKNLLFKPVMDIISARESEIQSNLAQGERAKREGNKLVLLTASKVIEKDIDKFKHQELINNFINEVAIDGSK